MVTGCSAGIGAAIAQQLLDQGMNVVAVARRVDKIKEAVSNARKDAISRGRIQETKTGTGKLYPHKCDVSKEEDILAVFKWVTDNLGGVDLLVNNAGIGCEVSLTDTNTDVWRRVMDVNVLGLSICTREAVQSMRSRGVNDGHIVHISSVCSYLLPNSSSIAVYTASKHAVRALTEGLRKDLVAHKEGIKVTSVCPGLVKTDIVNDFKSMTPEQVFQRPHLQPEDIADAVLYVVGTPPSVQIHELIIKPVGEEF